MTFLDVSILFPSSSLLLYCAAEERDKVSENEKWVWRVMWGIFSRSFLHRMDIFSVFFLLLLLWLPSQFWQGNISYFFCTHSFVSSYNFFYTCVSLLSCFYFFFDWEMSSFSGSCVSFFLSYFHLVWRCIIITVIIIFFFCFD